MNKEGESVGFFSRLKHLLQIEPKNTEELLSLLKDAHLRQLIDEETLAMIEGVIHFSALKTRDIMIPKNQMICLHIDASFTDILSTVSQSGHSRFPVYNEGRDEIIGILHAKDLLKFHTTPETDFDLHDILRATTFIPESKPLDTLLSEFRKNRNHMAIVVDEYGSVTGFITIEDIIEQIIGDIEDEFDIDDEVFIKQHSDHHYILKAQTPIEAFNETLETDFSDETQDTIGGILIQAFGHMPQKGERIVINNLEFKILNADARRLKLLQCIDNRGHTDEPSDPNH